MRGERNDANVVKAIISFADVPVGDNPGVGRALYFTRATAPTGDGPLYHHIGLYAYRRAALKNFVEMPPSPLERRERLEQLRALEAGMRIDVALVDRVPVGVDTPADLEKVRRLIAAKTKRNLGFFDDEHAGTRIGCRCRAYGRVSGPPWCVFPSGMSRSGAGHGAAAVCCV